MTSPHPVDHAALFDVTPTPYLVLTPELVIVGMNRARELVTGTRRADVIGCHLFDAFPENPRDPGAGGVGNLRASLQRVLATGEPHTMAVQRYDIPDRSTGGFVERYWSPVNVPVLDEHGRVVLLLHRVEDVTDYIRERRLRRADQERDEQRRRRLEEVESDLYARTQELGNANQRLRDANAQLETVTAALRAQTRAKDRFLATLSHELRTPLAAARAALDVLALDVDGHPALDVLDRQSAALTRMSDDLLDAARGMTGRLVVRREELDLRTVVEQAVGDARSGREAGERAVALRLPDQRVRIGGDPIRLAQVIANLLDNAVKHTPADAAITIELEAGGEVAELRVRDTGPGLPAGPAPELFEPFTRAAAPGRGTPEGLGLGLAVVRAIVAAHGGTVTAHSDRVAGGATFTIRLPLLPPADAGRGGEIPPSPAPPRRSSLRVLVIDDNEDLARSYGSLLAELGHEVTLASSGEDGLRAAQEHPFDVVLCDIALGAGVDGHEVARRLRSSPAHGSTWLVAVSGSGRDGDRARALAAGFDTHATKPLGLDALATLLRPTTRGRAGGPPTPGAAP